MSSMISPIEAVCPFRSSRALSLRRKPSSLIALRTRPAVSGVTPGSSLTTRDTVLSATPARVATSFMVGRPRPFRGTGPPGPLGTPAPLAPPGPACPAGPVRPPPEPPRPGGSPSWPGMRCARSRGRLSRSLIMAASHVPLVAAGTLGWPPACSGVTRPACRAIPAAGAAVPTRPGVRCHAFRRVCPGRGSPQRQVCYKRGFTANTTLSFSAEIWFPTGKYIVVRALVFGKSGSAW